MKLLYLCLVLWVAYMAFTSPSVLTVSVLLYFLYDYASSFRSG